MADFFLTIDASSVYSTNAPVLEVLINGSVVSSIFVNSGYLTSTYQLSFNSSKPSSLSFRFNDGSVEGGRSITLNSVRVNGIDVDNANLSALTLNQNDSSDLNITNTDYLFGKITPTLTEMGTPTIDGTNSNERLDGTAGDDIIRGRNGNDKIIGGDGDDRIIGENGLDHIFGNAGNDIIHSGKHNDRVHGGDGDDLIYSHNDNDVVYGDAGRDVINAGNGNDKAYGGTGDDILYGGGGNDKMYGGDNNDRLEGQSGNDILYGQNGDDRLYGSSGLDFLYGGNGNDYLNGGNDGDRLYGGVGDDDLRGGNQDDWLYGDDGKDDIRGGNHNDKLIGGAGIDSLRGESGNDILFYDSEDKYWGGSGFDWVVLNETETGNVNFGSNKFKNGIEGISLENDNGGLQANNLAIDAADVLSKSDLPYFFVAGDNGLDTVTSANFDITDRVAGDAQRGGRQYAHFNDSGADIYIEIGLDLNGITII